MNKYLLHDHGIRFLTVAFLGDVGQRARWCTPPIKALLPQWWSESLMQGPSHMGRGGTAVQTRAYTCHQPALAFMEQHTK